MYTIWPGVRTRTRPCGDPVVLGDCTAIAAKEEEVVSES
jgi:hypothetical protein